MEYLITSITFTIRGSNNNLIDELRIGRTYGDVLIPEPWALGLLATGYALLVALFRRDRAE